MLFDKDEVSIHHRILRIGCSSSPSSQSSLAGAESSTEWELDADRPPTILAITFPQHEGSDEDAGNDILCGAATRMTRRCTRRECAQAVKENGGEAHICHSAGGVVNALVDGR